MLAKFDLGAEVDIATGADVAGIDDKLGKLLGKSDPKPLLFPATGAANGNGVIVIGRPRLGELWNILSITLLGSDDHTTVAGSVGLYVDSEPSNLNLSNCRIPNLSIPSSQFITKYTLWAHSTGDVCANVQGTTGNPQVVATITVAAYRHHEVSGSIAY